MNARWRTLCVLFAARTTMAFQFQAVGALSPVYVDELGIGLADVGLLIGLYLSPGLIFAMPGGALGRRFTERKVVLLGMGLMCLGAVLMAISTAFPAQIAGRLIAGTGGVFLNVLMSKMVADTFSGKEIATAMGVFVNSWPLGISLALIVLPPISDQMSLTGTLWLVVAVVTTGFLVFWSGTSRGDEDSSTGPERHPLGRSVIAALILAGLVWGLFNGGLGMVFSFGPTLLIERGMDLAPASATTGIAIALIIVATPLGGYIADRFRKPDQVILFGLLTMAVLFAVLVYGSDSAARYVLCLSGFVGGLTPGPIMSLPAAVLTPRTGAIGMGLFFTIFYFGTVSAPIFGGAVSSAAGTPDAAFLLGIASLIAACLALLGYRIVLRRMDNAASDRS